MRDWQEEMTLYHYLVSPENFLLPISQTPDILLQMYGVSRIRTPFLDHGKQSIGIMGTGR